MYQLTPHLIYLALKCDIDNNMVIDDMEVKKNASTLLLYTFLWMVLKHLQIGKDFKVTVGWFLEAKGNLRKLITQKGERREKMMNSRVPKERIIDIERVESEMKIRTLRKWRIFPISVMVSLIDTR